MPTQFRPLLQRKPRLPFRPDTWLRALAAGAALLTATGLMAAPEAAEDPVWAEMEVPAPPAFSTAKLVDIDMGPNVALSFGIDPAAASIGKDGVVRYVVVAQSRGGASTAMYEGIKCDTGQVKTYARYNDNKWSLTSNPEWRSLFNNAAYRHALALAKQGACSNTSPPRSIKEMVSDMKNPRSELAH
jgi:hypothetical protein